MHNDINDLPNKAISIIKNGDITELSADIIELAFSLDPSVLLKFGIDLNKNATNISNRRFAKKYCYFILGLKKLNPIERYNVIADLKFKGNEGGEILLSLIERLDSISKVEILSNLVIARIHEEISVKEFFRATSVLEKIPFVDIDELSKYQEPYFQIGVTDILFSSGAVTLSSIGKGKVENDEYVLTEAAYNILKYGLKQEVSRPKTNKIVVKGVPTFEYLDETLSIKDVE